MIMSSSVQGVCHPTSLYSLLKETSFVVVPVAILAASFWILSSSLFSYWVQLSHITSPLSRSGLINVK